MEKIPQIVLQLMLRRVPDTHPEPDLLAAFAEQGLRASERSLVLGHLSRCRDCRDVVAMGFAPVEHTMVVKAASGWLRWPALRWGAAVACVAVVGSAIGFHEFSGGHASSTGTVLVQSSSDAAASTSSGTVVANSSPATMAKVGSPEPNRVTPRKPNKSPRVMTRGVRSRVEPEVATGKAKESLAPLSAGATLLVVVPPSTSIPSLSSSGIVPRWTLAEDGSLQRSQDGGMSWQSVAIDCACRLRAVSTVGSDVWVGGSHGALYHSKDAGEHWDRVFASAADGPLSRDIIGVEFTDADHGKITTSGQQVWKTADSGLNWQKQ